MHVLHVEVCKRLGDVVEHRGLVKEFVDTFACLIPEREGERLIRKLACRGDGCLQGDKGHLSKNVKGRRCIKAPSRVAPTLDASPGSHYFRNANPLSLLTETPRTNLSPTRVFLV